MSSDVDIIRRLDHEWNESYRNRDIEALDRILSDDWIAIDGSGLIISKQEIIERLKENTASFTSHEFDEFRLRLFDRAAIVTGRLTVSGENDDGDFVYQQRFTRVYVKINDAWQAVAAHVTVVNMDA